MGLTRQGVQRIVNELAADGQVAFRRNPHHRRAKLVVLTDAGGRTYEAAMRLQGPWVEGLARGLGPRAIADATRTIEQLRLRLDEEVDHGSDEHD
jgi:DNA-binding MarR family transcriptional regulator